MGRGEKKPTLHSPASQSAARCRLEVVVRIGSDFSAVDMFHDGTGEVVTQRAVTALEFFRLCSQRKQESHGGLSSLRIHVFC